MSRLLFIFLPLCAGVLGGSVYEKERQTKRESGQGDTRNFPNLISQARPAACMGEGKKELVWKCYSHACIQVKWGEVRVGWKGLAESRRMHCRSCKAASKS
ncbi:hypothetical protein BKA57DRAFT_455619 [Linnemannia elongata]|nr:hypothetical protein BKA57DRAFT_455619 [Linnemannia elongata]